VLNVVRFVDDDEAEAIADTRRPRDRARVGGDRDRCDAIVAVAEAADRVGPCGFERACPLIEQDARRYDNERADAELGDRRERDECLARARRQHDDTAIARVAPRVDGFALVPAELGQRPPRFERGRLDGVREADVSGRESATQLGQFLRGKAPGDELLIEPTAQQLHVIEAGFDAVDHEGSFVESNTHATADSKARAVARRSDRRA